MCMLTGDDIWLTNVIFYIFSGDKRMDVRARFLEMLVKLFVLFVMLGLMMSSYFLWRE